MCANKFLIAIFDDNPIHRETFRGMLLGYGDNVRLEFYETSGESIRFSDSPMVVIINRNTDSRCPNFLLLNILKSTPNVPVICYSPEVWCGERVFKKYAERLVALTYHDIASGLLDYVTALQEQGHWRDLYSKNKMTFVSDEPVDQDLSPRERDIFCLLGKGYGSLEIADILDRKKHTIDSHLKNIRCKLNFMGIQNVRFLAMQFSKTGSCPVFSRYENHICLCRREPVGTCPRYDVE